MLGALPLALGTGIGAELRRPLGVSIVGGLLLSQLVTLYTTPVIYLYMERFSDWLQHRREQRALIVHRLGASRGGDHRDAESDGSAANRKGHGQHGLAPFGVPGVRWFFRLAAAPAARTTPGPPEFHRPDWSGDMTRVRKPQVCVLGSAEPGSQAYELAGQAGELLG